MTKNLDLQYNEDLIILLNPSSSKAKITMEEEISSDNNGIISKIRNFAYNIGDYTHDKRCEYTGYVYLPSFYEDDEYYQKLSDECNDIPMKAYLWCDDLKKFLKNKNNLNSQKVETKNFHEYYSFFKDYLSNELKEVTESLEECRAQRTLMLSSTEALTKSELFATYHTPEKAYDIIDRSVDKERKFMYKISLLKNLQKQLDDIWEEVLSTLKTTVKEAHND